MCLPLGCLKCLVQFSAWITTLIGIVAFVAAIVFTVFESNGSTFQNADIPIGHGLVVTFWIFAVVILLIGISGIVGGSKKISCLLFLYNLGNIGACLGFLILAIVAFILAASIGNVSCSTDWAANLSKAYNYGQEQFCQKGCECYISNATLVNTTGLTNYTTTVTTYATSFQDCPQYTGSSNQTVEDDASFFSYIETKFQCAGWCEPYSIYVYSNINNANQPDGTSCFQDSANWIQENGNLIGYVAISASILLGFCVIFTFCLCCHPEKKNQGNFYTRMAYYDGQ